MDVSMNPWTRFVGKMATKEAGTGLALVRLAVGLSLLADLLDTWTSGAATYVWLPPDAGGWHVPSGSHWLVSLLGGPTTPVIRGILAVTVAAVSALVAGVASRPAALVALVGSQALFSLDLASGGGHDRVFLNALWLLVLARSDATLSVTCRVRTGRWTSEEPVPAWPRYLLAWQLVLMYASTGLSKLGAEWWPSGGYSAVWYALQYPSYARYDLAPWLAPLYPLTQLATAITVPWEMTWPLVLALPRRRVDLRFVYIGLGVLMHGTLLLTMNLGPFAQVTTSLYFSLFSADEYAAAYRWIGARLGRQPTISTSPATTRSS